MTDTTHNEQLVRTQRNAELQSMVDQLKEQNDRRADYVVPATTVTAQNGRIHVASEGLVLDPTPTMISTMAPKHRLDLPVRHMRGWHEGSQDPAVALAEMQAFDAVLNAGLAQAQADGRSFLLRSFAAGDQDGGVGIGRALLSDKFRIIDNFDVLLSTLDGIRASGVEVQLQGCDLTENRMRVRFYAPAVQYLADEWLKGYRNPFGNGPGAHSGYGQGLEPVVFAGFEVSNSETGGGKFKITPRIVVQICRNGYQLTKHVLEQVHLGAELKAGEINWSADTQQKNQELVAAMTRDAVAMFLDADFLEARIEELTEEGKAEVPAVDAPEVVQKVAKAQRFSEAEAEGILGAFIGGGQLTAAAVGHAVTAHAQRVADPERAAELEASALAATSEAARLVAV